MPTLDVSPQTSPGLISSNLTDYHVGGATFHDPEDKLKQQADSLGISVSDLFGYAFPGAQVTSDNPSLTGLPSGLEDFAKSVGMSLNNQTRDYLIQAYLNEQASDKAWHRSVTSAKNQYQWLVQDLIKAGINPVQALNGFNAASATSTSSGVSGGLLTSKENEKTRNTFDMIKSIITSLGTIIGLALFKRK